MHGLAVARLDPFDHPDVAGGIDCRLHVLIPIVIEGEVVGDDLATPPGAPASSTSRRSPSAGNFLQIWNPNGTPATFGEIQEPRKLLIRLAHRKRFELLTPRFV